jgi:hypothetical protein
MTFLAMPTIFNRNGSKEFPTMKEAKSYLDETTGYIMPIEEWFMIGKIMKVDENGQLTPAIDIRTISV